MVMRIKPPGLPELSSMVFHNPTGEETSAAAADENSANANTMNDNRCQLKVNMLFKPVLGRVLNFVFELDHDLTMAFRFECEISPSRI